MAAPPAMLVAPHFMSNHALVHASLVLSSLEPATTSVSIYQTFPWIVQID
jgi:hypothetical protein